MLPVTSHSCVRVVEEDLLILAEPPAVEVRPRVPQLTGIAAELSCDPVNHGAVRYGHRYQFIGRRRISQFGYRREKHWRNRAGGRDRS